LGAVQVVVLVARQAARCALFGVGRHTAYMPTPRGRQQQQHHHDHQ